MSWYVLEGPDGGGKTTFAKALTNAGWQYEKCTIKDTLPRLARRMVDLRFQDRVVWDRAHISEAVYHPERWSQGWFDMIEGYLIGRRSINVAFMVKRRQEQPDWGSQKKYFSERFLASKLNWIEAVHFTWEPTLGVLVPR